jgi:uncharacterized protein YndB with AHSA1/START domain
MARIVTTIEIRMPIERVFDYATTAGNWPSWHPASRRVSGATDHSAVPGERIIEEIETSGRRWRAVWTVREREPPHLWVIEGEAEGGGGAMITYRLTAHDGSTRFERELVYRMPNAWLALLDRLFIRRRMAAQSAEALHRLQLALERDPAESQAQPG